METLVIIKLYNIKYGSIFIIPRLALVPVLIPGLRDSSRKFPDIDFQLNHHLTAQQEQSRSCVFRLWRRENWKVAVKNDKQHSQLHTSICCHLLITSLRYIISNVTIVTEVQSASTHLFVGMWCPLVSVVTTLYYVMLYHECCHIFHHRVWHRTFSLRHARIRSSGIFLTP